ncbi:hypothetical protein FNU79_01810 [Deinococcus detaillensis]|uniref:Uncharacterized protein n=1 Tax=Deinococcus detaillensis TaxID=2592048 RepID=A0A553V6E3_9DEIO|nr:hypothetical protein [Deinococcus detaillensis]TSA88002.1 hypothetical protein FNU79_01810 [Deinococcus detaillensis]
MSRFTLRQPFVALLLTLSWAYASPSLPTTLPSLQSLDVELNAEMNGLRKGGYFDQMADEQGITCQDHALFLYQDGGAATQSLNSWLSSAGLQAVAVGQPQPQDTTVMWRADNESKHIFGLWRAGDGGGKLMLCAGEAVDVAARTADRAAAKAKSDQLLKQMERNRRDAEQNGSSSQTATYGIPGLGLITTSLWFYMRRLRRG